LFAINYISISRQDAAFFGLRVKLPPATGLPIKDSLQNIRQNDVNGGEKVFLC